MASKISGYVGGDRNLHEHVEAIRNKYSLGKVFRFDLGQNNDGCAPEVAEKLAELLQRPDTRMFLKEYPALSYRALRGKLADLHGVPPDWMLVSAGVEQTIGLIAYAFLEAGERIVVNHPSFFVFESFSRRMGATIERLPLREHDGFNWTTKTIDAYRKMLHRRRPKIIWVANPNNPTGLSVPEAFVEYIAREAYRRDTLVVFDEAYGEYTDPPYRVNSASRLLHTYDNLIVLRSFSKAYGLAGMRIGYAISSNPEVLRALKIHSYNYPITQLSLELAECALDHMEYLVETRRRTRDRRDAFLMRIQKMERVSCVGTDCCILMICHKNLCAESLGSYLERRGIFTSKFSAPDSGKKYIRVTLRTAEDNRVLLDHLKALDNLGSLDAEDEENRSVGQLAAEGGK